MDFPNSWATPKVSHTEKDWWVGAFYGFAEVEDPATVKGQMDALLDGKPVYGSILVAEEGANGTICAPTQALLTDTLETLALTLCSLCHSGWRCWCRPRCCPPLLPSRPARART